MVINREMKSVEVLSYGNSTDSYGQVRKGEPLDTRTVMMALKLYRQAEVADPRFVEVTDLGLTNDTSITDKDCIKDGDTKYNVLYVIPSQRLTTVFLKKVK